MSVIFLNGLPGRGKNLTGTYLAIKHLKKDKQRKPKIVNNVYSSYPILLDKRKSEK